MRLRELAVTSVAMALVLVAGSLMLVPTAEAQTVTPLPMCTAQNVIGAPYSGLVCGGSVIDDCTPGALYQCVAGLTQDNCTFAQACAVGCLTGPASTSITLNTSLPTAADACFVGPPPLTLSTNSTLGGNDVTLTATLTEPHSPFGAGIHLFGNESLVAPLCNGGLQLAADATTLSFDRPTSVVSAPTFVPLSLLIGFTPDPTTGKGRTLVSTPTVLTLNPGGVQLPATVSSFTLTPSTIPAGQGSSIALTMTRASAAVNQITVTSSNPSIAFSNEQPGPNVAPGCTTANGTIWSTRGFVLDTTAVTIGASAQGQVPVTNVLTVTATPLNLSGLSFNPASALTGSSSVGTVTINRAAPVGGVQVFLTTRPGTLTGALLLNVPASVTIPEGQTSASFTATVPALSMPDSLWTTANISPALSTGAFGLQVSPVLTVYSITFDPDIRFRGLVSGTSATATVTLYAPAPVGGAVVALGIDALNSSDPTAITVPDSVTVPEGATSATFTATANHVTTGQSVRVLATLNGFKAAADIGVGTVLSQVLFGATVLGGTPATGTVLLRAPAPLGGAVVTLSNSNPAQVTVPPSVTVPAGATSVTFTANTSVVPSLSWADISATYDGATVGGRVFFKPPSIDVLFLTPTSVVGGNPSTGTVRLDFPAVAGGSVVTLASDSAVATVPPSVTVPAGATSATFTVTTSPVGAPGVFVIITGTLGTFARAGLSVTPPPVPPPPPPGPVLSTVSLSPASVVGGASATGTVTLSAPALSGGGSVSLSCSSTSAIVPVSITVPAGAISATFTVTTTSVAASTSAVVNAGYGGVSKSATLTVNPGAPAAPSLISPAVDATPAQPVTFDWTDVANATSYQIQIANSSTFTPPLTASQTVSASQATISGLPTQRLWWRVRASNSAGVFGPFSASQRFTPQAAPAACTPTTCAAQGKNCGPIPNGCGGTLTCGVCTAPQTCGGGGVANVCGAATACTPTTCAAQGKNCGTIPNGCGGTLTCGVCTAPQTCGGGGVANVCGAATVCTPTTCAAQGKNCGTIPNGCGGTLTCGACTAPQTCGGGGVANVCGLGTASAAVLTVTATGRAGESISSTPAGLAVNVGTTGSASFATGTSVTLTVSNGRVATWSGGCSSNGAKVKTCTVTINAATSVTANVQ